MPIDTSGLTDDMHITNELLHKYNLNTLINKVNEKKRPRPAAASLSSPSSEKQTRSRTHYNFKQIAVLEEIFAKHLFCPQAERKKVAKVLGLTELNVKHWFKNRRAKFRRTVGWEQRCHSMNDEESAPDYIDHVLRNHYPEHFHPSQVSRRRHLLRLLSKTQTLGVRCRRRRRRTVSIERPFVAHQSSKENKWSPAGRITRPASFPVTVTHHPPCLSITMFIMPKFKLINMFEIAYKHIDLNAVGLICFILNWTRKYMWRYSFFVFLSFAKITSLLDLVLRFVIDIVQVKKMPTRNDNWWWWRICFEWLIDRDEEWKLVETPSQTTIVVFITWVRRSRLI